MRLTRTASPVRVWGESILVRKKEGIKQDQSLDIVMEYKEWTVECVCKYSVLVLFINSVPQQDSHGAGMLP